MKRKLRKYFGPQKACVGLHKHKQTNKLRKDRSKCRPRRWSEPKSRTSHPEASPPSVCVAWIPFPGIDTHEKEAHFFDWATCDVCSHQTMARLPKGIYTAIHPTWDLIGGQCGRFRVGGRHCRIAKLWDGRQSFRSTVVSPKHPYSRPATTQFGGRCLRLQRLRRGRPGLLLAGRRAQACHRWQPWSRNMPKDPKAKGRVLESVTIK